ncbi:MAG: hypothetical protein H7Y36_01670 [Armatimonadetes bacterium]|nr:hypothetical protein [Akkermansiaceae bacterium]
MANILGIFTAIFLAIAAFVASKNNSHFQEEIENKVNESRLLTISQARLKAAQEVLKALPIERADVDSQTAAKGKEEAELTESNAALLSDNESKTAKVASNKTQLDDIREKTAKIGNVTELAGKMKTMRIELEELAQSISSNEATLANVTAQTTASVAEAKRRQEEFDLISKGESLATLRTRIRSIYPTWGFVTLADGNNAGVVTNSTLDVLRDNEVIAKLLVTAVETRTSSASIIPDSIGENVTLMVGDRVIAGSKSSKKTGTN